MLVDEHAPFRTRLRGLFCAASGFEIIADAQSVREDVEKALLSHPDVILVDYCLPHGTGPDVIRSILGELPEIQIVGLTNEEFDGYLFTAIQSGAKGCIRKNMAWEFLLVSLQTLNGDLASSEK